LNVRIVYVRLPVLRASVRLKSTTYLCFLVFSSILKSIPFTCSLLTSSSSGTSGTGVGGLGSKIQKGTLGNCFGDCFQVCG